MELGKIAVESYGCTMNQGEARQAAEKLSSLGHYVVPRTMLDKADSVLLFTCDVIKTTENRMWKRIEEITSSGKRVIVAGCLAAIATDEIMKRYPSALILDSMGLNDLDSGIEKLLDGHKKDKMERSFDPSGERIDSIVPISTGCAGNCSYCITRLARGKVISYPQSDIIERVRSGVKAGRIEILLTSQDTAAYGLDGTGSDLGSLLRSITSEVREDHRIRVGMMNPVLAMNKMESILNGFDDHRIFKFFHLPVQSGSDVILNSMRRGYTVETFWKILKNIRARFQDVIISTDLIVGFPGETDEDHRSSVDILEQISPEILNITRFSSRPGTDAESMTGQIKGWVMKDRSRELTRLHSRIVVDRLKSRLGYHPNCLVTEVGKKGTMMARDENYTPIVVEGGKEMIGKFIDIDTSDLGPTYLMGGSDWKRS